MRDAFVTRLLEEARHDRNVMLITGDLGFGVLTKFEAELPRQYLNAGVAEQNMTMLATGLAMEGRVVFTYSIANFPILRCLEMIRNDACYHGANVKVVSIGGGFSYGALGISHHATEDLAIMRSLPEITVLAPCDLWEAAEATSALIRTPGTAYLRLDKSHAPAMRLDETPFRIGEARILREGSDVALLACGGVMSEVLSAAESLSSEGIEARVVSHHTVKPIDRESILACARETGGIVTVEEHTLDGGLGSAVAEVLADSCAWPRGFQRIGLRSGFSSEVGSQEYLRQIYGINSAQIESAVHGVLGGSRVMP
ncbi:MAG: transketolase [Fimbriimonadaceae bacterium]|nr:transketolase [Fimbriimonadaceae bacterium]